MKEHDWEKLWRGSMGVALPVAFVSAAMDRTLITTVTGLWENLTPWRLLFFLSSAFLLAGLARNSSRLRKLAELQAGVPAADLDLPEEKRPPSGSHLTRA
ncbi:MAG: hypothetical protein FJ249_07410 [Nitrospira sp.]|nr:hypothetical protein [Nitrospira sp.]